MLLAGLWRGLARTAASDARKGVPLPRLRAELYQVARWRAARYGVGGTLVDLTEGYPAPVREVVGRLLAYLRPALEEDGDWEEVAALVERSLGGGNGAMRQRTALARRGEMADVLALLLA